MDTTVIGQGALDQQAATYGRGVAFPVALAPTSRVALSAGPENIATALRVILATEPGERLMLPAFGAGLRRFLFEPNIPATHRQIEDAVRRAVARWEPRVTLDAISVTAAREDPAAARIDLHYRLVATGTAAELNVSVAVGAGARGGAAS
jgi:phage baseplate assembly protein W